jgi:hypothetical protein
MEGGSMRKKKDANDTAVFPRIEAARRGKCLVPRGNLRPRTSPGVSVKFVGGVSWGEDSRRIPNRRVR